MTAEKRFTGFLHCRNCGETGPCSEPSDWCQCVHHSRWEKRTAMCPDLPDPQGHGFVRHLGGHYEPVYA